MAPKGDTGRHRWPGRRRRSRRAASLGLSQIAAPAFAVVHQEARVLAEPWRHAGGNSLVHRGPTAHHERVGGH